MFAMTGLFDLAASRRLVFPSPSSGWTLVKPLLLHILKQPRFGNLPTELFQDEFEAVVLG
jgi:hypothetical protein